MYKYLLKVKNALLYQTVSMTASVNVTHCDFGRFLKKKSLLMIQTSRTNPLYTTGHGCNFFHLHVFIYLITLIFFAPIGLENIIIEVRRTRKTNYFRDIQIFQILLIFQIKVNIIYLLFFIH